MPNVSGEWGRILLAGWIWSSNKSVTKVKSSSFLYKLLSDGSYRSATFSMGRGAGRAWLHSSHRHTVAVPHVAELAICRSCCDSLPPGWNGGHISSAGLSPPATPCSLSCASAGVITQGGHFAIACKHTHTCTHAHISKQAWEWVIPQEQRVGETGEMDAEEGKGGSCDCSCCIGWSWFSFFCLQWLEDESQGPYLSDSRAVLWLWTTAFTSDNLSQLYCTADLAKSGSLFTDQRLCSVSSVTHLIVLPEMQSSQAQGCSWSW